MAAATELFRKHELIGMATAIPWILPPPFLALPILNGDLELALWDSPSAELHLLLEWGISHHIQCIQPETATAFKAFTLAIKCLAH